MAIGIFICFFGIASKGHPEIRVQTEIEQADPKSGNYSESEAPAIFTTKQEQNYPYRFNCRTGKAKFQNNPKVQEQLEQLSDNLQELNVGMRDLYGPWIPPKTILRYLKPIYRLCFQFCETAGVRFSSGVLPEKFKELQLNMANRRHLLMIFKEALNNSIKHGNPKQAAFNAEGKTEPFKFH